jgi:phage terminase small subunit
MAKGQTLLKTEERERAFALKYIELDRNALQAAIAIGIPKKGAHVQANRLLNSVNVQRILAESAARIIKRHEITVDKIIQEMAKIGFASLKDYVQVIDGEPIVDMSATTDEQFAALGEITITDSNTEEGSKRTVKVKLLPKMEALTKLLTHLGGFDGKGKPEGDTIFNLTQLNVNAPAKKMTKAQIQKEYFDSLKDISRLSDGKDQD